MSLNKSYLKLHFPVLFQKFRQELEYIFGNNILWQLGKISRAFEKFINLFRTTGENKLKNLHLFKVQIDQRCNPGYNNYF